MPANNANFLKMLAQNRLKKNGPPAKKSSKPVKKKSSAHPGFKNVQQQIAQGENVSMKAAGAILAKSSRHASPKAKKANPNLKKVH